MISSNKTTFTILYFYLFAVLIISIWWLYEGCRCRQVTWLSLWSCRFLFRSGHSNVCCWLFPVPFRSSWVRADADLEPATLYLSVERVPTKPGGILKANRPYNIKLPHCAEPIRFFWDRIKSSQMIKRPLFHRQLDYFILTRKKGRFAAFWLIPAPRGGGQRLEACFEPI